MARRVLVAALLLAPSTCAAAAEMGYGTDALPWRSIAEGLGMLLLGGILYFAKKIYEASAQHTIQLAEMAKSHEALAKGHSDLASAMSRLNIDISHLNKEVEELKRRVARQRRK